MTRLEIVAAPCEGCESRSRRRFLGRISTALVAALVGSELSAADAATLPVTLVNGSQSAGGDKSYPIPASDGATIDREAEVILVRFHDRAMAFNLACPHQNAALKWRSEDQRFQCPRHQSKYQPDGTFISGRATRNMDRFAIHRSGDMLIVDLTRLYRSDEQQAEWTNAVVTL
jgi:nitrite reductase/ring-hydroxylating ferredoxin subunit